MYCNWITVGVSCFLVAILICWIRGDNHSWRQCFIPASHLLHSKLWRINRLIFKGKDVFKHPLEGPLPHHRNTNALSKYCCWILCIEKLEPKLLQKSLSSLPDNPTVSVHLAVCQTMNIRIHLCFLPFSSSTALQLQVCITYSPLLKATSFFKLQGCIFEGMTRIYCCNKPCHIQYHSASMAMAFKHSPSFLFLQHFAAL